MQRDLAASIGIEGATLTHHLNRMERRSGRAPARSAEPPQPDGRPHADGEALFERLLTAVVAFDHLARLLR